MRNCKCLIRKYANPRKHEQMFDKETANMHDWFRYTDDKWGRQIEGMTVYKDQVSW